MPIKLLHEDNNKKFLYGMLKCLSHARGKYCWILGDDDFITGKINNIMSYLKNGSEDLLIVNHFFYIGENGEYKFVKKDKDNFLFRKKQKFYTNYRDYIFNVRHPNAFFTHVAPVIFKRSLWNSYSSPEVLQRHSCSESIHIYFFLMILKNSNAVRFVDEKMVALRIGAPIDVWLTEDGRYHRIKMDVELFTDMVRDVFNEDSVVRHFKDLMLKKSILVLIVASKIRCNFPCRFNLRIFRLLYVHYKAHLFFWYGIIPALIMPRIVFLLLYKIFIKRRESRVTGYYCAGAGSLRKITHGII